MNIAEFQQFIADNKINLVGGALNNAAQSQSGINYVSPQIALLSSEWEKVRAAIAPHFYGDMPASIIEAFPNETPRQKAYRDRVNSSPTKDKLWKAITDTNRITMSANFVMNYGESFRAWLDQNRTAFNGYSLMEYLGIELYPQRVLDPNGFYAVLPNNMAEMELVEGFLQTKADASQEPIGVKMMYYPSASVVFLSDEVAIFVEPKIKQTTLVVAKSAQVYAELRYRVFTKTTSFLYNPTGEDIAAQFTEFYQTPLRNELPLGVLGGRWIPRTCISTGLDMSYFESDFSFAVPAMNELNVLKNQQKVITCTSVFPATIVRPIPCRAEGCKGGKVQHRDKDGGFIFDDYGVAVESTCGACKGSGLFDATTMDIVVAPQIKPIDGEKPLGLDDYIYIVKPDVSAVQELGAQVEKATDEVNQALTILQQKIVGQSAESKDADMQDKQTFLANIAVSMARISENILRWTAYVVLNEAASEQEISAVNVAAPKTFNIMTIEALRQLRDQNRGAKSLDVRAREALKLIEKESDNPLEVRGYELLHRYTENRSEALQSELESWLANDIISPKEYAEALFAASEIRTILAENSQIEDSAVFALLQQKFAKYDKNSDIAAVLTPRPNQLSNGR